VQESINDAGIPPSALIREIRGLFCSRRFQVAGETLGFASRRNYFTTMVV
jgi:hypothetical protein